MIYFTRPEITPTTAATANTLSAAVGDMQTNMTSNNSSIVTIIAGVY